MSLLTKPLLHNTHKKDHKNLHNKKTEKKLLSIEIFLNLSSLAALIIGFNLGIFTIADAIAHSMGFTITNGLQLQTLFVSTLLALPFYSKRWQKYRQVESKYTRRRQLFIFSLFLIFAIFFLGLMVSPFIGESIEIPFISHRLSFIQWKLFILGWWFAITSLLTQQTLAWSQGRPVKEMFCAILFAGTIAFLFCSSALDFAGRDYFLTILHNGIPAYIISALPIIGLMLNLSKYQGKLHLAHSPDLRKQDRYAKHLSHTLIQNITAACCVYWTTGLTVLSTMLLMVAVPSIMLILLI